MTGRLMLWTLGEDTTRGKRMTTRIVELRRGILKKNDELAAGLRSRYGAAGVLVLNLVSSPGTAKPPSWSGLCASCAEVELG